MTMRMLLPSVETAVSSYRIQGDVAQPGCELLEALQGLPFEDGVQPPDGTRLLKLVPPRWNADEGVCLQMRTAETNRVVSTGSDSRVF